MGLWRRKKALHRAKKRLVWLVASPGLVDGRWMVTLVEPQEGRVMVRSWDGKLVAYGVVIGLN